MNELNNKVREVLGENTTHYERTCWSCGYTWLGLHCPHDGYQNECGNCNRKPSVIDYHDCTCKGVTDLEEATQAIEALITEQVRLGEERVWAQIHTKYQVGDIVGHYKITDRFKKIGKNTKYRVVCRLCGIPMFRYSNKFKLPHRDCPAYYKPTHTKLPQSGSKGDKENTQ